MCPYIGLPRYQAWRPKNYDLPPPDPAPRCYGIPYDPCARWAAINPPGPSICGGANFTQPPGNTTTFNSSYKTTSSGYDPCAGIYSNGRSSYDPINNGGSFSISNTSYRNPDYDPCKNTTGMNSTGYNYKNTRNDDPCAGILDGKNSPSYGYRPASAGVNRSSSNSYRPPNYDPCAGVRSASSYSHKLYHDPQTKSSLSAPSYKGPNYNPSTDVCTAMKVPQSNQDKCAHLLPWNYSGPKSTYNPCAYFPPKNARCYGPPDYKPPKIDYPSQSHGRYSAPPPRDDPCAKIFAKQPEPMSMACAGKIVYPGKPEFFQPKYTPKTPCEVLDSRTPTSGYARPIKPGCHLPGYANYTTVYMGSNTF